MPCGSRAAPWYIVDANIKRRARLNVIFHLLSLIPYEDLTPEQLELPPRQEAGDYQHPDISLFHIVPARYPLRCASCRNSIFRSRTLIRWSSGMQE